MSLSTRQLFLTCLILLSLAFGFRASCQDLPDRSEQLAAEPSESQNKSPMQLQQARAKKRADDQIGFAKNVFPLFIQSAKDFSKLAIAALGLTIVFREKVLGETSGPMEVSWLLISSWTCFLISILSSIVYQWVAIRIIAVYRGYESIYFPLTYGFAWPGPIYGLMTISFFLGALLLGLTSSFQLLAQRKKLRRAPKDAVPAPLKSN